ncbi:hypothetical protein QIH01_09120 [Brevibacillus brevis]|nr:hypothetical protein QIH01_09120 [Brevibacillus brevis]
MQAGRELDKQVAEALGWEPYLDEDFADWATDGHGWVPKFSTTWDGMGVLVEEAAKQGIAIQLISRFIDGVFIDFQCLDIAEKRLHGTISGKAPHAVCLAFLKSKGIDI